MPFPVAYCSRTLSVVAVKEDYSTGTLLTPTLSSQGIGSFCCPDGRKRFTLLQTLSYPSLRQALRMQYDLVPLNGRFNLSARSNLRAGTAAGVIAGFHIRFGFPER